MSEIEKAAREWVNTRSAMSGMQMNDPNWRSKLNDLSEAEDKLSAAVRSFGTGDHSLSIYPRHGGGWFIIRKNGKRDTFNTLPEANDALLKEYPPA